MPRQKWLSKPATSETIRTWCPQCFSVLSATSCMTAEAKPEPGDFTVCAYCAAVLRFNAKMDLEISELAEIPVHSRLAFAQVVQKIKEFPMPKREKGNPFVTQ